MSHKQYIKTLSKPEVISYLTELTSNNPLKGTILEQYKWIESRQRGSFGELYIQELCKDMNYICLDRTHTDHDMVINGVKAEIKFSVSMNGKSFTFNHITKNKDYDRLILVGVDTKCNVEIGWITRETAIEYIDKKIMVPGQSGKNGNNDDYIYKPSIEAWKLFLQKPYVKDFSEW